VVGTVLPFPSLQSVERSGPAPPTPWLAAVLLFGVGDVVTTGVGLGTAGVAEANPVAARLFAWSALGGMIVLKGTVFGVGYALWRRVPHPHCTGVPVGLAAVGAFVTAWNLSVLLRAVL
jgi:hypothetical protein